MWGTRSKVIIFTSLFCFAGIRIYCAGVLRADIEQPWIGSEEREIKIITEVREKSIEKVRSFFPSPHSELLLGMLLGLNDLGSVPRFNDVLRKTGTIHVVVVSGYNISLVFLFIIRTLGSKYKMKNLIIAEIVTFIYALVSGLRPPTLRAWIMMSTFALGSYYGREVDAVSLLLFTGLVMVAVSPDIILSLSFQLSFLATLGLVLFSRPIKKLFTKFLPMRGFIVNDLCTSLAAQVLVWPLISYHFGRVSLVSPLVNGLVLWTVPYATVLGFIALGLAFVSSFLGKVFFFLTFPFTDIFVKVASLYSSIPFSSIEYKFNELAIIAYYLIIFIVIISRNFLKSEYEKGHIYSFNLLFL